MVTNNFELTQHVAGILNISLNSNENGSVTKSTDEGSVFQPCNTVEELLVLEQRLSIDKDFFRSVKEMLKKCHQKTLRRTIYVMLRMLMSDKAAMKCNYGGRNGKLGLEGKSILLAIKEALNLIPAYKNTHDMEFKLVIQDWLKNVKARSSKALGQNTL
ncbi:hypothetical protein FQR65_LT05702 [Abscondita terminalis]|nr:hypothetical protein FQR65_LT05702 [Abscondita terminalis]